MKQSFFDVVDEQDQPIGKVASFDEVHRKGLWCRGVHVVIYTEDGNIVMQKRAPSLKYHPSEIEVSVGGGVDAGETPVQAGVREVAEEVGIELDPSELHFVGITKYNHKVNGTYSRNFLYSYTVCLPKERLNMLSNPDEVTRVFLITKRQLRRALRMHRIARFGKISSLYAYWNYLLDAI